MRASLPRAGLGGPALLLTALLTGCTDEPVGAPAGTEASGLAAAAALDPADLVCDPDNGGLTLPPGFCAIVVADLTLAGEPAAARHMAITPSGELFVAINSPSNQQPVWGIFGLRDGDGDGRAEERVRFSRNLGGSGIAWRNGLLFFGANDRVLRYRLPAGRLEPIGPAEIVVGALPDTGDHISKTVVLGDGRKLFVNIGSASNACQVINRERGSPGVFPCPELSERAGVWLFDALGTNQSQSDGSRFATGLRNMVALTVHPGNGALYGVQHGRDDLFENWPRFFTIQEDAVTPAEELVRIGRGTDNGWPYCYFDEVFRNRKVLAPEYGGDGERVRNADIDCARFEHPLLTFPAHWAPNGIHFYTGTQFPERYHGGAFIAFHGGHDRAPLPNEGYQVVFAPFDDSGLPVGTWETFADDFAQSTGPLPATAKHRPVGVIEGPDGSLYISDDAGGRIWRIIYTGS
jgi:glucose/arabinose dehydrogenase